MQIMADHGTSMRQTSIDVDRNAGRPSTHQDDSAKVHREINNRSARRAVSKAFPDVVE
jgi:hypothetical protein